MKNPRLLFFSLLILFICASCTGTTKNLIVSIDQQDFSNHSENRQSISNAVEVFDVRESSMMKRESLGVSLGQVTLKPNEINLIKSVIENALHQTLRNKIINPELKVYCGIKKFDISTPSTAFSWNIITKIRIILRVDDTERMIESGSQERTYIWPSEDIINRVTTSALNDLFLEAMQVIPILIDNKR